RLILHLPSNDEAYFTGPTSGIRCSATEPGASLNSGLPPVYRNALSLTFSVSASLAALPDPIKPDPNTPRPMAAVDSVFIEDLTWMEVRDALHAGKDTVIVATGGVEQNGPYLVTGKHNIILRATTEAIARKLGNALV